MRYWVRADKDAQGPYTLEDLAAQGLSDSTLVCPEDRPRHRRENWLPLRKAKAPPKFYARVGAKVSGPYSAEELALLDGFCGDSLVCPERRNFRSRWNWAPARNFSALRPAQAADAAAAAPEAPHPEDILAGARRFWDGLRTRWRRPPALPLAMGAAAIILGVLLWMKLSYLPRVRQTYQRVHASMGLMVLAAAQERYRKEHGAYAPDLDALTAAAGPWLPELLAENLDLQTLLVRGASGHFLLEANSLDERRTLVRFEVPAPGRKGRRAASANRAAAPASHSAPAAAVSASTVPAKTP